MEITHTTKNKFNLRDNSKGQKIVAALYLVTQHLSDNDPFKTKIRSLAVLLIDSRTQNTTKELVENIQGMLNVSSLANIISQRNVAMLNGALNEYLIGFHDSGDISKLFDNLGQKDISDKINQNKDNMSFIDTKMSDITKNTQAIQSVKSKRQNEILKFVNKNKSVGIKDISAIFPDVSEKTVQREISSLVDKGLITKRGNKRWSIYLSINK